MGSFYASVGHSYEKIGRYVIQQRDIKTERNEPFRHREIF